MWLLWESWESLDCSEWSRLWKVWDPSWKHFTYPYQILWLLSPFSYSSSLCSLLLACNYLVNSNWMKENFLATMLIFRHSLMLLSPSGEPVQVSLGMVLCTKFMNKWESFQYSIGSYLSYGHFSFSWMSSLLLFVRTSEISRQRRMKMIYFHSKNRTSKPFNTLGQELIKKDNSIWRL